MYDYATALRWFVVDEKSNMSYSFKLAAGFSSEIWNNSKQERFPNAAIVYSAILPRDHDNETIREVNKQMSAEGDHFSAYHLFERSSRQFYKNSNNR